MECPLCGTDLNRDDILLIPHKPGVWEVAFHCSGCSRDLMHLLENWQVI